MLQLSDSGGFWRFGPDSLPEAPGTPPWRLLRDLSSSAAGGGARGFLPLRLHSPSWVPGVFQERRHHQELQVPLPAAFTAAGPARARPGLAAPTPEERRGAGQKLWNTKPSRTQHKSPGAEPRTPVAKPEARTNPSPHTTGHLFYFILFKMLVSGLCIYLGVTQEGHWKSTDLARTEPHVCLGKVALFFQP
ncbi:uncharacterized protein LOC115896793 isoform X3 [Rhinopithecus roxellana]|uniref:uncharacterized protein LOC115896793 isoform X3 n=1 Tax=Rhinopithecus roxellana TaxID=61622 RepID=UPI0012379254|nr:uncharacterized protein LOC115896793 isoform X3 [Rhinopithecus roxellana]XP_030783964.1 uncharacterized protein LOC115896793 isoform X3 [Rhinopithecus roxellana]XP_030783965.1 uncharacterized protein LOC115896793 isoform X3 [Rhinopithecus roxellana]XP_030783966.1 uncharacterized protein LOC115896793 isoform X3 [Rhinopithecus roxellana]XP_030783967.1 uncharacterized protein LOC115896793 isoform X3 [Rhinopithecus roxellana]XP_030783968.1 uncharacterized protein LOC115896793 isoform X3 [Rhinop